jgi:spermidine dehydrogenase
MKARISRRDFLNGVALGAAGLHLSPLEAVAAGALPMSALGPDYYPPALTGMRGSVAGTYEIAHALAREGRSFSVPTDQTDADYDLVVVGGGISGLAAAKFFRDQRGTDQRILILDNHDDFGGHARRNELTVDGHTLIGYGGSQAIDTPSAYSKVASQLLRDIGIEVERFDRYFDHEYFSSRDMTEGIYFDAPTYGKATLTPDPIQSTRHYSDQALADITKAMPLSVEDQQRFHVLLTGGIDYLQGMTSAECEQLVRNTTYLDFLDRYANQPEAVRQVLQDSWLPMMGAGWEAISTYEALYYGFPGTDRIRVTIDHGVEDPYIYKFPDGNASVARALVRYLIPEAIPGDTMEDLVTARADYSRLDQPDNSVRIRLNSTAVNVRHTSRGDRVDVAYVQEGKVCRVRGRHVVMACYNQMIPHLCPEATPEQNAAIAQATKIPFVLGTFALRNWEAFRQAGYYKVYSPGKVLFQYLRLDFPVSLGSYQYAQATDEPILVTAWYSPRAPGLPAQDQYRAGRAQLMEMAFSDFETDIVNHFDGMLGPYGFDVERDMAGITLNRWPHGYAYEFEGVGINPAFGRYNGPHIQGRARIGRISIANSDSEAHAYVDGAVDAAYRAVSEQLAI